MADLFVAELFEQLQSTDAGHPDVQQQTSWPSRIEGVEKLLRRTRTLRLASASNAPNTGQCLSHGRIVVDDEDGGVQLPRLCSPRLIGNVKWKVLPRSGLGVTPKHSP